MRPELITASVVGVSIATGGFRHVPKRMWVLPPRTLAVAGAAVVAQRIISGMPNGRRFLPLIVTFVAVAIAVMGFRGAKDGSGATIRAARIGRIAVGVGALLNLVAIVAYGAMPVWTRAMQIAGVTPTYERVRIKSYAFSHFPTRLGWLGDVIPLPHGRIVLSIGDLVVLAGFVLLVRSKTRPDPADAADRAATAPALTTPALTAAAAT